MFCKKCGRVDFESWDVGGKSQVLCRCCRRKKTEGVMKLVPLFDRVLVIRDEPVDKTPGGILLPDSGKEKPQRGKVIAVGEGRRDKNGELVPMVLQDGDRILFSTYAGNEVEIDGKELLIMSESDVLAKIN